MNGAKHNHLDFTMMGASSWRMESMNYRIKQTQNAVFLVGTRVLFERNREKESLHALS